ncbi:GTPase Der [Babesia sp. Xinjiang]|uniref:GTPase Der n=1 Tax=Babesia sp. Xinjiang TaxID=462227 RepID=UPI000A215EA7|nr:GTPase Der [Babesia sp. Xinjiang]ORM40249.1 GTPase Der [Babesia sp. Xinjiang]
MLVTLLGRSNVGKSSLFNALAARNTLVPSFMKSIVSDKPGTTRNAKHGQIYIKGRRITLVDTGGIDSLFSRPTAGSSAYNRDHKTVDIEENALRTAEKSDVVLFVVDGQEGVTPLDMKIARKLQTLSEKTPKSFILKLILNKLDCEGTEEYYETLSKCLSDCYSLGLGDPVLVSADNRNNAQNVRDTLARILDLSCDSRIRDMEQLALLNAVPGFYSDYQSQDTAGCPYDVEINKSIRVCSTVNNALNLNERWIRHLGNVCDSLPFSVAADGGYVIPSALSPGEMLARMYIPKARKDFEDLENEQQSKSVAFCAPETEEIKSKGNKTYVTPNKIRPIRIVLLGSVGGCQAKLADFLSDCRSDTGVSSSFLNEPLSPNWHQFNGEWTRQDTEHDIVQPVEIYMTAALNLGGSIGKIASIQTLNLMRRADVAIMCCGNTDERKPWEVTLTKQETSWMARLFRLHKPAVIVAPVTQSLKRKMVLDMFPRSHEFASIPIHSLLLSDSDLDATHGNMPLEIQNRALRNLKRGIISLIDRAGKVIETNVLNKWLRSFLEKWPPPWHDGAKVNVKFAAQENANPPTFVIWSNVCGVLPDHYMRQLKRAISEEFGYQGVPLKFILRTTAKQKSTNRVHNLSWKRKLHDV